MAKQSNVVLPTWPSVPLVKPNPAFPAPYDSGPDADARVALWSWREFMAEAAQFARANPGHPAASAKFYVQNFANLCIADGADPATLLWQVQSTGDDFTLNAEQAASLNDGCTRARMYGTGFTPACYHDNGTKVPDLVAGGSFANNNYDGEGNVTYQGIDAADTLKWFRDGLTSYLRAGGVSAYS